MQWLAGVCGPFCIDCLPFVLRVAPERKESEESWVTGELW